MDELRRIRVVICNRLPIVLAGIRAAVDRVPHLETAAELDDDRQLVVAARTSACDVIIAENVDAFTRLRQQGIGVPVLLFSCATPEVPIGVALRAGAAGLLPREIEPEELVRAIEMAAEGRRYISPLSGDLVASFFSGEAGSGLERLSNRELQVLQSIASGKELKQVAHELAITISAVSTYRVRLMKKLALSTTADLIRFALKHGLID